ncbi:hypothetical protein [Maricaulis maris]|uniref:hypothetical protein n=1 Tax=Maricaulis maris TaxID=74318 RepID=UPI0026EF34E9|nr:hypothetical protein [Maricaulis maris]
MHHSDPFEILAIADDRAWPDQVDAIDLWQLAVSRTNRGDIEPLRGLLRHSEAAVRRRGLGIFSELTGVGLRLFDDALSAVEVADIATVRGLLGGVLSYPRKLKPAQISALLQLGDQADDLARSHLIIVIGASPPAKVLAAIDMLPSDVRAGHAVAVKAGDLVIDVTRDTFDEVRKLDGLAGLYAWAQLFRIAARREHDDFPFEGPADDFIAESMRFQIVRRSRRYRESRRVRQDYFSRSEAKRDM